MAQTAEIPISGQATANVRVNIRQGAPSVQAPVLRKLNAQMTIPVLAIVAGDNVQDNPQWYRTADNAYAWSGAFAALNVAGASAAPAAAPSPSVSLNQIPLVIDLSHWDGINSFGLAYAAGVRGIIHKATTGASGVDDGYATRRGDALKAGLLWGAFHWGTAAPVDQQVANFLNNAQIEPNDTTTLVALDFETDVGNQMTLDGARQFLTLIEQKLNRKAVLYSGDVAKSDLGSTVDGFFGGHRLWLAQYGPNPTVQRSWNTYWLWQYSAGTPNPAVPGLPGDSSGHLDCNYFPGTADDLKAQWAA